MIAEFGSRVWRRTPEDGRRAPASPYPRVERRPANVAILREVRGALRQYHRRP